MTFRPHELVTLIAMALLLGICLMAKGSCDLPAPYQTPAPAHPCVGVVPVTCTTCPTATAAYDGCRECLAPTVCHMDVAKAAFGSDGTLYPGPVIPPLCPGGVAKASVGPLVRLQQTNVDTGHSIAVVIPPPGYAPVCVSP